MVVPDSSLPATPTVCISVVGSPRANPTVDLLVAANLHDEPLGEGVDDGHADAVEPARDLVAVAAELPPACSLVRTTVSAGKPCSGMMSTGIPAPASRTVTELSG